MSEDRSQDILINVMHKGTFIHPDSKLGITNIYAPSLVQSQKMKHRISLAALIHYTLYRQNNVLVLYISCTL